MIPVSPVLPGFEKNEIIIAKDQPQYRPLPALMLNNGENIVTRWRLSWRERLRVLLSGDVYLQVYTFGKPLQPVLLETRPPEVYLTHHSAS